MISTFSPCNVFLLGPLIAASLFSSYSSGFEWLFLVFICIMLVVLIVWIAVAYWVYKDAKKRNENAVLWLVIVLVASWLGLLLWFVLRPPIGGRKTTSLRYCPNCGREILFDANFCSYCGKKFDSYL